MRRVWLATWAVSAPRVSSLHRGSRSSAALTHGARFRHHRRLPQAAEPPLVLHKPGCAGAWLRRRKRKADATETPSPHRLPCIPTSHALNPLRLAPVCVSVAGHRVAAKGAAVVVLPPPATPPHGRHAFGCALAECPRVLVGPLRLVFAHKSACCPCARGRPGLSRPPRAALPGEVLSAAPCGPGGGAGRLRRGARRGVRLFRRHGSVLARNVLHQLRGAPGWHPPVCVPVPGRLHGAQQFSVGGVNSRRGVAQKPPQIQCVNGWALCVVSTYVCLTHDCVTYPPRVFSGERAARAGAAARTRRHLLRHSPHGVRGTRVEPQAAARGVGARGGRRGGCGTVRDIIQNKTLLPEVAAAGVD